MTTRRDISDHVWLTSDAARPWLARAAAEQETVSLVALTASLRRDLSPERTHLVLEQLALRKRARSKFRLAERMFFTPVALEQSTDQTIARHKAERFPAGAALVDLCTGIGGDAIGLALRGGRVQGIERDPVHALFATANVQCYLAAAGVSTNTVAIEQAEAQTFPAGAAAWHADPDRRSEGRRTTAVELHDPPRELLDRWLAEQPAAAIKLAPAARLPAAWQDQAESEWISRGGECRQLVAWFGDLARTPGRRRATIVAENEAPVSIVGDDDVLAPEVRERVGRFVFEPDAAVLAAQLVGTVATRHALWMFAAGIPYLSGDVAIDEPLLACFEVQSVLPFRLEKLKAYCREHSLGRIEVKKRGVDCEPATIQRQLSGSGDHAATILIARQDQQAIAIVARRIERSAEKIRDASSNQKRS